jgi:hypothetical protein
MFNERIDSVLYRSKKEINTCYSDVLVLVTRRVPAVMACTSCHVAVAAVTHSVGSGSEAPDLCPKDVKISAPLRDRFRYVQSFQVSEQGHWAAVGAEQPAGLKNRGKPLLCCSDGAVMY